jgi:hypothetical protein
VIALLGSFDCRGDPLLGRTRHEFGMAPAPYAWRAPCRARNSSVSFAAPSGSVPAAW